jgi:hypothetical protein
LVELRRGETEMRRPQQLLVMMLGVGACPVLECEGLMAPR